MPRVITLDLDKFLAAIRREVSSIESTVLESGCSDYPAYRNRTGERKGLLKAKEILLHQINKGEDDDDG